MNKLKTKYQIKKKKGGPIGETKWTKATEKDDLLQKAPGTGETSLTGGGTAALVAGSNCPKRTEAASREQVSRKWHDEGGVLRRDLRGTITRNQAFSNRLQARTTGRRNTQDEAVREEALPLKFIRFEEDGGKGTISY